MASSLLVVFIGLSPSVSQVPATLLPQATVGEQYLYACANAERAQRGLQPLHWDNSLYQAADTHARQMASRGSISHQYPGEPDLAARARRAGASFSVIAENVAEAPTAIQIHDAWMASPGHRANLLDPHVNAVGIRILRHGGQMYAVEDFSRTVEHLSILDQETYLRGTIETASNLQVLPATETARQTCAMDTGYAGSRKPWFVMRYTTDDLKALPDALRTQLSDQRYRHVEVAACDVDSAASFSSYRVAVLLYP